jgi:sirohydrochlorin ferrochelatase
MRLAREDRWLAWWLAALFATAAALIALNAAGTRFVGASYFERTALPLPFAAGICAWIGFSGRGRPKETELISDFSLYAFVLLAMPALMTGVQYTPFAPIDAALARGDAALGWNGPAVLHWTAARPSLRYFLASCYESTDAQLVLAPVAAALAAGRRRRRVLIHAMIYSLLAGALFYYFFPSSGPAGVYGGSDYLPIQHWTSEKFALVHARLPGATLAGGIIAFPSFHVAWSAILVDAARGRRWLFWPALALNAVVVASTVLLGWHFLVDVPAGLALAAAALAAGEYAHRRLSPADPA